MLDRLVEIANMVDAVGNCWDRTRETQGRQLSHVVFCMRLRGPDRTCRGLAYSGRPLSALPQLDKR